MKVTYFAPGAPPAGLDDKAHAASHCQQTTPTSVHDLDLVGLAHWCRAAARVGRKGDAGYIIAGHCATTRKEGGPAPFALLDQDEGGGEPDWAALKQYEGFAWTTASHRPDKPSWRVVIPFITPMAHGALKSPFRGAHIRNRTQPAFLPTHRIDTAGVQWDWLGGTLRLDAAALGGAAREYDDRETSLLGAAFEAAGMVLRDQAGGVVVRCPWVHMHSDGEAGGSVVLHADPDNRGFGKFHCSRTECMAAKRYSNDALNAIRAIPAVAAELAHWVLSVEGWERREVAAPIALVATPAPAVAATVDGAWTLLGGSLMGAPQSVERSLKSYRAQHLRRDPGAEPELANSSAVIKWLTQAKGWDASRVTAELGGDAGRFATSLTQTEVQSVGRLTRIDQALGDHELRWNEMALCVEVDGERWTDNHTAGVRLLLEQTGASDPEKPTPNGDIEQRSRAKAVPYHPVSEYLAALPAWDGVRRVDGLWTRYFGADATDLNTKLGACFALGAVRRVLEPGAKVDMMPILLGNQGDFKSSGLSKLVGGPPFFTDAAPGFGHRSENAMTLTGCWVWEIAEMQGMDRADLNAVKAFVTRSEDDVLLPYARTKSRLQRRSVLVGTTNEEHCLTDQTGSRRHPVIHIHAIDLDTIVIERDLFWAEALHRVRAGEPHWLAKEDEHAMGARNAEKYTKRDESVISALCAWFDRAPAQAHIPWAPTATDFTISDAVSCAFGGRLDAAATRIGTALKQMGVQGRRVGRSKIMRYPFPSAKMGVVDPESDRTPG